MDTEKQRQCRRNNMRLTTWGWPRETPEVSYWWCLESLTNKRMAARRALEWIGTSKARLVLDMKYQTCFQITWKIFNVLLLQYPAADHGNVMCDEVTNLGTIFLTLCSSTGARLGYHWVYHTHWYDRERLHAPRWWQKQAWGDASVLNKLCWAHCLCPQSLVSILCICNTSRECWVATPTS